MRSLFPSRDGHLGLYDCHRSLYAFECDNDVMEEDVYKADKAAINRLDGGSKKFQGTKYASPLAAAELLDSQFQFNESLRRLTWKLA